VPDDIQDGGLHERDYEGENRDIEHTPLKDGEGEEPDPSQRKVTVREYFMRVDYDGDGLSELRHVILVGTTILQNVEADMVQMVAFAPYPLPHQHYGLSQYDVSKDIQEAKTAMQ